MGACHCGWFSAPEINMPMRRVPLACCARAASGHATAAPLRSVMNSRRLMSDIGLPPPWGRCSVYRTLNLPQDGRQVLGPDLNCSESWWGAAGPLLCCRPNDSTHDAPEDRCTAGFQSCLCPLWVNRDPGSRNQAITHVRLAPKAKVGHQGAITSLSAPCELRAVVKHSVRWSAAIACRVPPAAGAWRCLQIRLSQQALTATYATRCILAISFS